MLSFSIPLAVTLAQIATAPPGIPPASFAAIPDDTAVHLGIGLRVTDPAGLTALLARLQDPASPDFHRWLTPEQFGARFGQPADLYEREARWLEAAGFDVTRFPNRIFLEAMGTAGQVAQSLSVRLLPIGGPDLPVHVPDGRPVFPSFMASSILHVGGLDTRVPFKHRLLGTNGGASLGPQDLRRFYDAQALHAKGFVGQGQELVVLGEAEKPGKEPNPDAIQYFLTNVSNASAIFTEDVLANAKNDFDPFSNGGEEFALDVEMQSVGSPGAKSITLVVSPASETFTTGVNHIVNKLATATAVSVSLGTCETLIDANDAPLEKSFQQLLQQGLTEGQTWSAASGDNGADDCQDGKAAAVDFPSSVPEMVALGGTQVTNATVDSDNAWTAYQTESGWNDGQGSAGGGGVSALFALPAYQSGFSFAGRAVPDIALIAGFPGVLVDNPLPGEVFPVGGTSVASPLSAGFFALIASRVGCRLGDIHSTLYTLGNAQLDGGAAVFHDVTDGTTSADGVTGTTAAVGYDTVTGWGSLDVAALAEAWPSCSDGGVAGPAYDACAILACDGGTTCQTIPEGPSSCVIGCDVNSLASDAGGCPAGMLCTPDSLFAGDGGVCILGCGDDMDCGNSGLVCSTCQALCVAPGDSDAGIGDACTTSADCPNGSVCTGGPFSGGYCTQVCLEGEGVGEACGCPAGAVCGQIGLSVHTVLCLQSCANPGDACARSGYICQPILDAGSACLPPCRAGKLGDAGVDTCTGYGSPFACDTDTGACTVVPDAGPGPEEDAGPADAGPIDAGVDAGPADAGPIDAGPVDAGLDAGPDDAGPPDSGEIDSGPPPVIDSGPPPVQQDAGKGSVSSGGCSSVGYSRPDAMWAIVGFALLAGRRRRAARAPKAG